MVSLVRTDFHKCGRQDLHRENVVRPGRFELPTFCSGGKRSIQLSYGRARVVRVCARPSNQCTKAAEPPSRDGQVEVAKPSAPSRIG